MTQSQTQSQAKLVFKFNPQTNIYESYYSSLQHIASKYVNRAIKAQAWQICEVSGLTGWNAKTQNGQYIICYDGYKEDLTFEEITNKKLYYGKNNIPSGLFSGLRNRNPHFLSDQIEIDLMAVQLATILGNISNYAIDSSGRISGTYVFRKSDGITSVGYE